MGVHSDKLRVGSITKPHGLKGAVKVYPTTDEAESFAAGSRLYIDSSLGEIPVEVSGASRFKNLYIVTFKEYTSIQEVEEFRGADLLIDRADARALAENEYFISDLIGLKVEDEEGCGLGVIREVYQTGANDVYAVAREKEKDLLIPAIRDCILQVDLEAGLMKVRLLAGM